MDAATEQAVRQRLNGPGADAFLTRLDRRREIDPAWFQRSRMIGYVCYTDRFAGTLAGVGQHLDYLAELGVTYLRLMPLLRPREGENDGGYAVADYGAVDPRLGTMADLEALAGGLHERDIALCVDLVLNHTAREHQWARKAAAGDPAHRDMYLIYPDRAEPDQYQRTLPEVFPDLAPGSFTEVPGTGWVWTTFHEFQWDLNYANPAVFRAMLATMLDLANRGVDVIRLDAAPFLWKRLGTDSQNQPEAHLLLQAYRALTRLAAPGLVLKAEAIVSPDMLVQYLGAHDRYRPRPPPPGSPTCAATTTSAGRCPTPTRPRPGWTGSRTGSSSATSTPATSPARSPGARCSSRTWPPATPASPAARPRCAGSRAPWPPAKTVS
jgi:amylosucrase